MTTKTYAIPSPGAITDMPKLCTARKARSGFSKVRLFFSCMLLGTALSSTVDAQTSCLTTSIRISTGYNPVSATYIPSGSADPKWSVAGLSANDLAVPGAGVPSYSAWVITPNSLWVNSTTSRYISFINAVSYTTDTNGTYIDTFTRQFTNCITDSITINIGLSCDDQIRGVYVDGTSIYGGQPAAPHMPNFTGFTTVNQTLYLPSGTHTIMVIGYNYPYPPSTINYHGVNVDGTVASADGVNSIVSETSACQQYVCKDNPADACDDLCYWRVIGNEIHNGNNVLGTLTADDMRILTSSTQRAVVKANGYLGINQAAPSTTMDVVCNAPSGGSVPSGLRLENLPKGAGNALVVDANGYVYMATTVVKRESDNSALQTQVDQLQQQVQALMTLLGMTSTTAASTNTLVISPNPSNGNMTAAYVIANNYSSAAIRVTDNQGREVASDPLTTNSGTLHINLPSSTPAGTYIFSLVTDGNILASQKAIIVK